MLKKLRFLLLLVYSTLNGEELHRAWLIPLHGPIDYTQESMVRRGLKQAQVVHCSHVILDLDTPGGNTENMINIIDLLRKSQLTTLAYVNKEAISAGSFIAMCCTKIYFHPEGVMGAAAALASTGEDLGNIMKAKIDSYLLAKVRVYCEPFPSRYEIQRAMMDKDFVWKDEETVIKPTGELLSLTAREAVRSYKKNPPLAAGIVSTQEELMQLENLTLVQEQKPTGFESLAKNLAPFLPLFSIIGMGLLILEFKTPGFGLWGCGGIFFLATPFLVNFLSGLGGFEPLFLLLLGALILLLDLFLFNTFIFSFLGFSIILGGLLWSSVDIWPNIPLTMQDFCKPLKSLGSILLGWLLIFFFAWKFGWVHSGLNRLTLFKTVSKTSQDRSPVWIGQYATTLTPLLPSGKAKCRGEVLEVCSTNGNLAANQRVKIIDKKDFAWLVEPVESTEIGNKPFN